MRENASDAERNCPAYRLNIDIPRQDLAAEDNTFQRRIPRWTVESPRKLLEGAGCGTVINLCLEDLASTRSELRPDQSYEWNKPTSTQDTRTKCNQEYLPLTDLYDQNVEDQTVISYTHLKPTQDSQTTQHPYTEKWE
jgi:hypothetical protein